MTARTAGPIEFPAFDGERPVRSALRRVVRVARTAPFYTAGLVLFLFAIGIAFTGPYLPLPDPEAQHLGDRLMGPLARGGDGTLHLAGTDNLGRDILARTVHGARVSLGIAAATALIAGVAGSIVGTVAGYRGGIVDLVVMRLVDLQMAFPSLVLAIFLLYLIGPGLGNLVLLLVIFSWAVFARMARAETLALRRLAFVDGAIAIGATDARIIAVHLVPHLLPVIAVIAVFDFAGVMLAEASLSYLGLGVQPPGTSWGLMLSQGKEFVYTGGWWLFLAPGLALSLTSLSANLTSRWLQHLFRIQD